MPNVLCARQRAAQAREFARGRGPLSEAARGSAAATLAEAVALLDAVAPHAELASPASPPSESESANRIAFRRDAADARREVETAMADAGEALGDLVSWRHRLGVDRPARYPASPLAALALVVLAVLVESGVNASLLRNLSDHGVLGGWGMALLAGLANVGLGLVGGAVGLRNLSAPTLAARIGGAILTAACVGGALAASLALALLRLQAETTASSGVPGAPGVPAWFEGGVLAFVGVGVLAWALAKGRAGIDDPVPGLGRRDRAWRRALEDLDEALTDARTDIEALASRHAPAPARLPPEASQAFDRARDARMRAGEASAASELAESALRSLSGREGDDALDPAPIDLAVLDRAERGARTRLAALDVAARARRDGFDAEVRAMLEGFESARSGLTARAAQAGVLGQVS